MNFRTKTVGIIIVSLALAGGGRWCALKFSKEFSERRKAQVRQQEYLRRRKMCWDALSRKLGNEIAGFQGDVGLVVKDLRMNWQISHNKNIPFPSASLVKVPIMIASLYAVEEGKLKLNDTISLKTAYKTGGSGVLKTFKNGTHFTVEQLIELMITKSDNTAANMLINMLGFDYLNRLFVRLGLNETNLSRKMMDFQFRRYGIENYTTASEMAALLEKLYRKEIINAAVSTRCLDFLKEQSINDRIPAKLPSSAVVAHKTGLERRVCHDVGIVFTEQGDYLICVLTKTRASSKRAKELISTIARHTYSYF